jgi:RNA polymerase sigma-70 factor (ECF subfamily)
MAVLRPNRTTDQFLQLYASCQERLFAYLTSLLGNYNDVQDVQQETVLALWKDFDDFQPGTNFYAWARRAAYHRVLTYRKQQRRHGVPCSEAFLVAVDRACSEKSDRFEEYLRYLNECVQKLTESDREILNARFQSQGTIKNAAEKLGRPTNTVYKALSRICRALAKCVELAAGRQERP